MRKTICLTLPLLLGACSRYETGIDRTVLRGTVTLAPESLTEGETEQGSNDDEAFGLDLGFVSYRPAVVSGTCLDYDAFSGTPSGDLDTYLFSPQSDGSLPISLSFDSDEGIVYSVVVYDLAAVDADGNPTAIAGGLTVDSGGAYGFEVEVSAGGDYAIVVGGTRNANEAPNDYTLTVYGFDPNGSDVLVGAYAEQDPLARTWPLGGTSLSTFEWDDATLSWSGSYEVLFIRSLTTSYENEETEEGRTDEVNEAIASVWMHAGTYTNLNSAILAGVSYATTAVEVSLSTDDAEQQIIEGVDLVIDETQPIQIGWEFAETEPNDVAIDGTTYNLSGDLSGANVLPTSSGLGYVDVLSGALEYTIDDPGWADDNDVFALTVSESVGAVISAEWSDAGADVDLHLYDSTGTLIAAGWAVANSNPEVVNTADWGITFEPGQTYYVGLFGYSGTAGSKDWSMSIEYTGP